MNAARPALVLFDLDDVLVHYDHGARCAALAEALGGDVDHEALRAALFGPGGLEFGCDRGEYGLDGYLDRLHAAHGWRLAPAQFVAARRVATAVDPAMLALCVHLAMQARLAIFSNNGAWIAEQARDIVPALEGLFGGRIVCSGALRASKPDPDAFRACLAHLGESAAHTLFIDDKMANADGARAAGLDALHFTGIGPLRAALRARGFVLPEDEREADHA